MASRAQLSALAVCAMLGTLTSSTAAGLEPPFNSYGVKFTCGVLAAVADDVTGTYATSINIHNPQATIAVPFVKKFIVAKEEGRGQVFGLPFIAKDNLPAGATEFIDCPLIYAITKISPGTHIDGFIVLEIPPVTLPTGATALPDLDVVGKHTALGATVGGAVGLEIVTYSAKVITF